MSVNITRPQQTIMVTDLVALADVLAANEYINAKDKPGMTGSRSSEPTHCISACRKQTEGRRKHHSPRNPKGLNASNGGSSLFQLHDKRGRSRYGRTDRCSNPFEMFVSASWRCTAKKISKNGYNESDSGAEDSQLNDLLCTVQNLNDPVTSPQRDISAAQPKPHILMS